MKNSSDTIGNRTRDLPVCSAVPEPTALPRTPLACSRGNYLASSPDCSILRPTVKSLYPLASPPFLLIQYMLTRYEQLFIHTFHHNGDLITEQGTSEHNPMFEMAIDTDPTSTTFPKVISTPYPVHANQSQIL